MIARVIVLAALILAARARAGSTPPPCGLDCPEPATDIPSPKQFDQLLTDTLNKRFGVTLGSDYLIEYVLYSHEPTFFHIPPHDAPALSGSIVAGDARATCPKYYTFVHLFDAQHRPVDAAAVELTAIGKRFEITGYASGAFGIFLSMSPPDVARFIEAQIPKPHP
jgi:hypothetical protein